MDSYFIGDLAMRAGLEPQTIRYYERLGVLSRPPRTAAGYRRYDERALEEIELVKTARSLGFTLKETKAILDVVRDGPAGCSPVVDVARRRLAELDLLLASLRRKRKRLAAAIERCGPKPCTITLRRLATEVIGRPFPPASAE